MLFSNHKFIFLCCVAVLSMSFILHTIFRHKVVGHYSRIGGRGEWESGTDWLFSLIVCIGMIIAGVQAVRRTLTVVVAAGTAASTAFLFLFYVDLPSFVAGVLSLIMALSLGVCGYPLLLAIVGTVVPPRRRLSGPYGAHRRGLSWRSGPLAITASDRTFARELICPFADRSLQIAADRRLDVKACLPNCGLRRLGREADTCPRSRMVCGERQIVGAVGGSLCSRISCGIRGRLFDRCAVCGRLQSDIAGNPNDQNDRIDCLLRSDRCRLVWALCRREKGGRLASRALCVGGVVFVFAPL